MYNKDNRPTNRIANYFGFDPFEDLQAPGTNAIVRLLDNLSISNLCRVHPFYEKTSYDKNSTESINLQKNNIQKVFANLSKEISELPDKLKRDYFIVLVKEAFFLAKSFREIKGFYIDTCMEAFHFHGAIPVELSTIADLTAEHSFYDDDWHNSKMDLFLSKEFRESNYWCIERLDYLAELLLEVDCQIDIHKILFSPQFTGVYKFLRLNPERFECLRDAHAEYLKQHIENNNIRFKPPVILRSLQILENVDYLESQEFRSARNICLSNKFKDSSFEDLATFMAFFKRDSSNTFDFSSSEKNLFDKLRPSASSAILKKVSLIKINKQNDLTSEYLQSIHDSVNIACSVFFGNLREPDNMHFVNRLREKIAQGTGIIFSTIPISGTRPPDILASLLPVAEQVKLGKIPELSQVMKPKLLQFACSYNSICKDLQTDNSSSLIRNPILFRKQLDKLFKDYLPCIERFEIYQNIFDCDLNFKFHTLATPVIDALNSIYGYNPGQFKELPPPILPYFSLANWDKDRRELSNMLESGRIQDACSIFCNLLMLSKKGIAPVSLDKFFASLPIQHRKSIYSLLGSTIDDLEKT